MKLWPTPEDHVPDQARFWVTSTEGPIVPSQVVFEQPDAIGRRLEADFPLYRAVNVGQRMLQTALRRDSNEV